MSKFIHFSRSYPKGHPRASEPTNFVEKIWMGLIDSGLISLSKCCELSRETGIGNFNMNNVRQCAAKPKYHTIRAGHRFKAGEMVSLRVWSGIPYRSAHIIIAPDVKIEFELPFKIDKNGVMWLDGFYIDEDNRIEEVAHNDGLLVEDFKAWFKTHPKAKNQTFDGQLICWSSEINY